MKSIFTLLFLATVSFLVKPASAYAQVANSTDSTALVDLYNATNSPGWAHHTNWITGPLSSWYGVKLDTLGRVTDLNLDSNNLTGVLPASMGNMIKMQNLLLNANKLTGPVPTSFNNYTRILKLDLSDNRFNFDGIEQLDPGILSYSTLGIQRGLPIAFTGGKIIISGAGGTPAYRTYSLSGAGAISNDSAFTISASGTYFATVTNSKIAGLQLYSDTIVVTLTKAFVADSNAVVAFYNATGGPAWTNHTNWLTSAPLGSWYGITLGANGMVTNINLPGNNLTGQIPANLTITSLIFLKQLNISSNQLNGRIPPKTGTLNRLVEINLSHNSFTGTLPDFSKLTLDTANFSYNQLSGNAMLFTSVKYEYLGHNNLTSVSHGANLVAPKFFDVSYNNINFTGVSTLTPLGTSVFQFQPQYPVELHVNNLKLSVTVAGYNRYGYTDYAWYRGSTHIITNSGDSTLLIDHPGQYSAIITDENLPAGYQLYTDTVTVTTIANTADSLALVDLYNATNGPGWTNHTNWLTGPLYTWFGVIVNAGGHVADVTLDSNNLAGALPASMGNLTELISFNVQGNKLTGSIPAEFGGMAGLTSLNLSGNLLESAIPATLGNLANLRYLDVSFNKLTGGIPVALSNLANLQTLNLSNNLLADTLPVELGNLTGISYLLLNNNNLAGRIPETLNNLTAATSINIAGNRFQWLGLGRLADHTLSVLNFNPQQNLPLIYDTSAATVSFDYASDIDFSEGYAKITWTFPAGGNPDDIDNDAITTPRYWSALLSGFYRAEVNVSFKHNPSKSHFILTTDGLNIDRTLPVKLTTLTGQLIHNQAFLNWQTASELNSSYFGIQRSVDGTNFTTVGKVAAAGTSAVTKNYQYTDALTGLAAMPAALYYRLQQVDKDGKQSLSKTIVLNPSVSSSLIMYPNPVHGLLNVRVKDIPGNAVVTIIDAGGKTLLAQTAKTVTGGQTISLNTSRLAAGVYVVHVQYNGQSEEQKFIKE